MAVCGGGGGSEGEVLRDGPKLSIAIWWVSANIAVSATTARS